jgi:hypothetical protein
MPFVASKTASRAESVDAEVEHSLVIPVYRNEENVPDLLRALSSLSRNVPRLARSIHESTVVLNV